MHILLEPHLDDAVLFASYVLLRHQPRVITVCSHATVQEQYGITMRERIAESSDAFKTLGVTSWEMIGISDHRPNWDAARNLVRVALAAKTRWDTLWLPWPEEGGHADHNAVADLGLTLFPGEIRYYATYRRGSARTRTENETVPEPHWPAIKFKAMACYTSQINLPNTRFWFTTDWDREWIA